MTFPSKNRPHQQLPQCRQHHHSKLSIGSLMKGHIPRMSRNMWSLPTELWNIGNVIIGQIAINFENLYNIIPAVPIWLSSHLFLSQVGPREPNSWTKFEKVFPHCNKDKLPACETFQLPQPGEYLVPSMSPMPFPVTWGYNQRCKAVTVYITIGDQQESLFISEVAEVSFLSFGRPAPTGCVRI